MTLSFVTRPCLAARDTAILLNNRRTTRLRYLVSPTYAKGEEKRNTTTMLEQRRARAR